MHAQQEQSRSILSTANCTGYFWAGPKLGDVLVIVFSGAGTPANGVLELSPPGAHRSVARVPAGTPTMWLTSETTIEKPVGCDLRELNRAIGKCDADILVLSLACYVYPDYMNRLFDDIESFPDGHLSPGHAFIFAGYRGVAMAWAPLNPVGASSAAKLTRLGAEFVRGMRGDADVWTPRYFEDRLNSGPTGIGRPDGYISLRELVLYLDTHSGQSRDVADPFVLFGTLGDHDVVLCRSSVPAE